MLTVGILPIEDGARLDQRGGGDHEAVRLDEAEPFEMGAGVGVRGGHACQSVYGLRQRARSARSRRCAAVTRLFLAVV